MGLMVLQQPPPGRRAIMAPPPNPRPPPNPPPPAKPRASALPEERLATATVAAAAKLRMNLRDMIVLRVWGSGLGTKTNSNARGTKDPKEGSKDFLAGRTLPKYRLLSVPGPPKPVGGPGYRRALAPKVAKSHTPRLRKRPASRRKFSSFWL